MDGTATAPFAQEYQAARGATMQKNGADRIQKIACALNEACLANQRGNPSDVIYHLRVAEWLCMPPEVLAPTPPQSRGTLLDIAAVSELTGYSKSRLRHMGHTLAGYWKSPTGGKVGWWSGPLKAALEDSTR